MLIALLEQLLADIARVVHLEGNQGRRVSRVLEQYFVNDVARLTVDFPLEMSRLEFATNALAAAHVVTQANFEMSTLSSPAVFSVEDCLVPQRSIVIRLVAQPPQSMRDRQQFLREIARGVETMAAMWSIYSRTEEEVLDVLFEDIDEGSWPQARANYLAGFNDLLDGNFALVNSLPMHLVQLACLISPAVDAANEQASQLLAAAGTSDVQQEQAIAMA